MLRIDSNLIWIIVNLLIFYFLIRSFCSNRFKYHRKEKTDGNGTV
mgnify:CR=1 FL=1